MKKILIALFVATIGLAGCSSDDDDPGPIGVEELISKPDAPVGPSEVDSGDAGTYRTGGSISTLAHPLQYRFDFDAADDHDYSAWSSADTAATLWTGGGSRAVRSQARCAIHNDKVSGWSDSRTVRVNLIPDTEIVRVVSRYKVNSSLYTREIDFNDAIPDTVPYGSWLRLEYRAADSSWDPIRCPDDINKCFEYQMNYYRESSRNPGFIFQSPWRPDDPVDTNEFGTLDSMSMNIGSMEYLISPRSVDVSESPARPDPSPPGIDIVGNFDPTLDSHSIVNYDGTAINHGDTIYWEWWTPADSGLMTVPNVKRTKTFYFVVQATGHDHPWEPDGSGVKSWLYRFPRAENPAVEEELGHAGIWLDGSTVNVLADTVTFIARYDLSDVEGDEIFVDDPPQWNNVSFDFRVKGRDIGTKDEFEQLMYFGGGKQTMNVYLTGVFGRWTSEDGFRFHLVLRR